MGQGTILFRPEPIQITSENWLTATGGYNFSVAIKSDSTLSAWGGGKYIYGNFAELTSIPARIGNENNWKFVIAGYYCAYGIKTDGTLWAWGWNKYGTLGDSTTIDRPTPVQIGKHFLGKVKYISTASYSIAVITEDGSLWTWGGNKEGQLGDGTNIDKYYPVQIGSAGEWKTVACGTTCIFAIKTDGTLWAWGKNTKGYLGDGTTISHNTPVQIGSDSDWADISYDRLTLALKKDGTLWAWGWNYYAGIGNGTLQDVLNPIQIGKDNDWVSAKSLYMRSFGKKKTELFGDGDKVSGTKKLKRLTQFIYQQKWKTLAM